MRGLKLDCTVNHRNETVSHPTWVRGLKLVYLGDGLGAFPVAPYVGAWIETVAVVLNQHTVFVAPYVGAWIETPS